MFACTFQTDGHTWACCCARWKLKQTCPNLWDLKGYNKTGRAIFSSGKATFPHCGYGTVQGYRLALQEAHRQESMGPNPVPAQSSRSKRLALRERSDIHQRSPAAETWPRCMLSYWDIQRKSKGGGVEGCLGKPIFAIQNIYTNLWSIQDIYKLTGGGGPNPFLRYKIQIKTTKVW